MHQATAALADQIREASSRRQPLRIRGGGSKDFLGQAFLGDVLDTRGMAGVVAYEPSELVVTVRAGTPLRDLEALLAEQGQCLAFEPPHFANAQATVGGMVAAGLSGPARASAGAVRDYVLGARLLNGCGQELVFGGQVMKNVAGYDVSRLMAGAMGMLGMLTEVSLKVMPVAAAETTLCFEMTAPQALEALHRWGGQPLPLNASFWSSGGTPGLLRVRLRGAAAAVEAACRSMGGQRMDALLANALWSACRNQGESCFCAPGAGASLWRIALPQTTPALALGGVPIQSQQIEWHGGQRWVWASADRAEAIRADAAAAGGHATLFRPAANSDRAAGVWTPLPAPLAAIHRRLKAEFDPAGIFNPGRLFSGV